MRPTSASITTPTRSNLAALLAFAAPVGVLLLSRVLAVQPPALQAQTQETPAASVSGSITGARPTAQQTAARQRSAEIAGALMDTSPLYYAPVKEAADPAAPERPAPVLPANPTEPKVIAPPQVTLSSIVRSADGQAIAFVNGRVTRVGDALGGGWTVTAIDPQARSVTMDHDRAEPVVITLIEKRR